MKNSCLLLLSERGKSFRQIKDKITELEGASLFQTP